MKVIKSFKGFNKDIKSILLPSKQEQQTEMSIYMNLQGLTGGEYHDKWRKIQG